MGKVRVIVRRLPRNVVATVEDPQQKVFVRKGQDEAGEWQPAGVYWSKGVATPGTAVEFAELLVRAAEVARCLDEDPDWQPQEPVLFCRESHGEEQVLSEAEVRAELEPYFFEAIDEVIDDLKDGDVFFAERTAYWRADVRGEPDPMEEVADDLLSLGPGTKHSGRPDSE